MSSKLLSRDAFLAVVRDTPLISIDLVVQDEQGLFLLGRRVNPPARDAWFVPGGRVRKSESLDLAFTRLCYEELGLEHAIRASASFLGVYEHFYNDNAFSKSGFGTHYVVLAYRFCVSRGYLCLPKAQHDVYDWLQADEIVQNQSVHAYSREYFI